MPELKNTKHERFCQLIADGTRKGDAYREALGTNAKSCHVSASQLLKKQEVTLRIEEIREEYRKHVSDIEEEAATLSAHNKATLIATKDEILKLMTESIRAKPTDARMDNPLCELKMSKQGPYAAFIEKAKAAERICKMMGYDMADKLEVAGSIKVTQEDILDAVRKSPALTSLMRN